MQRWNVVIVALIGIAIAGGILFAVGSSNDWDGWDRRHDGEVTTRVVDANGQETLVIREGGRPFFFPVGILFVPLFFLFLFGLARAFSWRGRGPWGGGPWHRGPGGYGAGYAPPWFEEWHRRAHGSEEPGASAETRDERSG